MWPRSTEEPSRNALSLPGWVIGRDVVIRQARAVLCDEIWPGLTWHWWAVGASL